MNSKCIMLIEESHQDHFLNKKPVRGIDEDDITIRMDTAGEALAYITSGREPRPDMVFLDIHMPVMDGWEFLHGYYQLDETVRSKTMIVVLPTEGDPLI